MDFICSRFIDGSPERYEIVVELLDRYRTSVGFDPMEISKGRFKRVKAAEFKKMLESIDQEVGAIMVSAEYHQIVARQVGFEPLFQEFNALSEQLYVHPPASMVHEVIHLEEILKSTEAYELLLAFYRRHTSFYTEINQGDDVEKLITDFDNVTERNNRLVRHTRCAFVLQSLTQQTIKGNYKEEGLISLLEELDLLYTAETNALTRYELLIKIVNVALLTFTPNRILQLYLPVIAAELSQFLLYYPDAALLMNATLAHHHYTAGHEQQLQWWANADTEAKKIESEEGRANLRLIKASLLLKEEGIEKSLRALDEAEHQIYKANRRNATAKNVWIAICTQRLLLYAIHQLSGVAKYTSEQYYELIRLTEELAKHRKDATPLLLEMKGLLYFIQRDWETANELFEKAMHDRAEHPSHPHYCLSSFFTKLLKNGGKKINTSTFISDFKLINEPFYTFAGTTLIEKAEIYFYTEVKVKAV